MKKSIAIAVLLLSYFSNFAFASPSPSQTSQVHETALPDGMPETISLLDTTPIYPEPDDTITPWASLTPQDVKVVRTQSGDDLYAIPDGDTWIQIRTWIGNMWIKLNNSKLGVIRPFDADLSLAAETPLYDHPYREAASGAKLSPQTVHAKAEFVSPSGFYAFQIETWLGDRWLIQPEIRSGEKETISFPNAVSPDYGPLMSIEDPSIIELGGRTFAQGRLVMQEGAWKVGRLTFGTEECIVYGKLAFWNRSGDVVAQIPYAVYARAGESMTAPLLLPVDRDLSSAVFATLQDTFPFYVGLPVPPLLNLTDPEKKVWLGILRHQKSGEYSVARAWIKGKVPGTKDYKITLTFYGDDDRILGYAHVHQRLNGPLTPDQAGPEGGGTPYLIDIVGKGDWTNYRRVSVHVDQVSD